jgi:membrane associated rhomboid family serine protease
MKRLLISAAVASSLALGGCASDPYRDHVVASSATGAAIGAGAGALAGAAFGGIGVGAGAAVGGVLGGAVGAIIGDRQYYRDTRGYCYYVDRYGQAHYNYKVRC